MTHGYYCSKFNADRVNECIRRQQLIDFFFSISIRLTHSISVLLTLTAVSLNLKCILAFLLYGTWLKLPQCLCIHLQRLSWSNQGTPLKRHEHVQFNEFLIMDIYKYHVPVHKPSQNDLNQKNSEETKPGTKDGIAVKPSGIYFESKIIQVFLHFSDKTSDLQNVILRAASLLKLCKEDG